MKTKLRFGTFHVPQTSEGTASFTVPAIFSKEEMKSIFTSSEGNDDNLISDSNNENQVTHKEFFGENIKRVINAFK